MNMNIVLNKIIDKIYFNRWKHRINELNHYYIDNIKVVETNNMFYLMLKYGHQHRRIFNGRDLNNHDHQNLLIINKYNNCCGYLPKNYYATSIKKFEKYF